MIRVVAVPAKPFRFCCEEITSEKLTEHLAIIIEFLKEIKEHQKNKIIKNVMYN